MKIAYLLEWDPYQNSGVTNKINLQCSEWSKNGHDVKIFMVATCAGNHPVEFSVPIEIFKPIYSPTPKGGIYTYASKISNSIKIQGKIKKYDPDVIYYRQGVWYPGLIRILKTSRSFFMEINTDDLSESSKYPFLKRIIHQKTRGLAIKEANGLITVTESIKKTLLPLNKNTMTIANGAPTPPRLTTSHSPRPSLIFIASPTLTAEGSIGTDWHGIDKFIYMAEKLPEFDFHLVGPTTDPRTNNLFSHGPLYGPPLAELLSKVHIGVGTLALHRKDMNEACPLKVREYLAHRLPIIIAYKDTDIKKTYPWVLQLENSEENAKNSIEEIKKFVSFWSFKKAPTEAAEIVSLQRKEFERLNFFTSSTKKIHQKT